MPTLSEIIERTALRMATVTVHVESCMGTVCISDDTGKQNDIFMQGDDASAFISEMNRLYDETGDLTKDTIALYLAEPYAENLWN